MPGRLEVMVLGSVEASKDSEPVALAGSKLQALVALLALVAPHPMSGERLIDELWGDRPPANPVNALQAQISHLRRLLGADVVARQGSAYRLLVEPDDVDSVQLERLLKQARTLAEAGNYVDAIERFESALSLVRGPPLAALADYEFGRRASSRLDELILAGQEDLVDARLAVGRHAETVTMLTELTRAHPLRERLHGQLIVALYRCGRQSEALRAYQDARSVLIEEFGIEPTASLRALERAVLDHDPVLDAPLPPIATPTAASTAAPTIDLSIGGDALFGRDAELAALQADLQSLLDGRGRVTLIGGEPGIGKTRLAEEFAAGAAANGVVTAWGRCYAGRGAPAFWPWTQVVSSVLSRFTDDELRTALRFGASELAQLVPEIKELYPDLEPPPPAEPESARFRLYEAISGFLRRLSRTTPIAVLIDDLHWADTPSMELFGFAGGAAGEASLALVATYRTADPTVDGAFAETLVEVGRRRDVRRLDVGGLEPSAVASMLATLGGRPSDEAVDTIVHRTRGNPFFVTEIMRLLPPIDGGLDNITVEKSVPASVRSVIRRRLARLAPDTISVLGGAAVLGHDFDTNPLAMIVGVDRSTLLHQLQPALDVGLVVDSPTGIGRYRFSHGLVQEALYHDLGTGQRADLHRAAAEAIEAVHGDTDGPHLLSLAEHWYRAVPGVPAERGIACARQAAMWALGHVAHEQAEQQLNLAIELAATLPPGPERAALELDLFDQLGLILIVTTSYTSPAMVSTAARTRALCDEVGDQTRLVPALWRLATHHMMRAEIDAGLRIGQELLERGQRSDGVTSATLAGHMSLGILLTQRGDLVEARRHLDAAIEMCDQGLDAPIIGAVIEEPAVFARVFSAINWWLLGEPDIAEEHRLKAQAIAERDGPHTYSTILALWGASTISVLRGEIDMTLAHCERLRTLAIEDGYPMVLFVERTAHGWAVAASGDPNTGAGEIFEGASGFHAAGSVYLRHFYLALEAEASLMAGRPDAALELVDAGLDLVASSGEAWYAAELHRIRGEALMAVDSDDPAGLQAIRDAIELARSQGALSLLERGERSLAAATASSRQPSA